MAATGFWELYAVTIERAPIMTNLAGSCNRSDYYDHVYGSMASQLFLTVPLRLSCVYYPLSLVRWHLSEPLVRCSLCIGFGQRYLLVFPEVVAYLSALAALFALGGCKAGPRAHTSSFGISTFNFSLVARSPI